MLELPQQPIEILLRRAAEGGSRQQQPLETNIELNLPQAKSALWRFGAEMKHL